MENFEVEPNIPTSEHPVLTALKERIETLEKSIENKNDTMIYWQGVASANRNAKEMLESKIKDVVLELHSDGDISNEAAQKIFDACDIEATKTVSISGSISFSGYVEVSVFEEPTDYDLRMGLSANLDLDYEGDSVSNLDYDVEEAEIS